MAEEREKISNGPDDRPADAAGTPDETRGPGEDASDRPTEEEIRRTEDALRDRGPDER